MPMRPRAKMRPAQPGGIPLLKPGAAGNWVALRPKTAPPSDSARSVDREHCWSHLAARLASWVITRILVNVFFFIPFFPSFYDCINSRTSSGNCFFRWVRSFRGAFTVVRLWLFCNIDIGRTANTRLAWCAIQAPYDR